MTDPMTTGIACARTDYGVRRHKSKPNRRPRIAHWIKNQERRTIRRRTKATVWADVTPVRIGIRGGSLVMKPEELEDWLDDVASHDERTSCLTDWGDDPWDDMSHDEYLLAITTGYNFDHPYPEDFA